MGILPDNQEDIEQIQKLLTNLDKISVREDDLKSFVYQLGFENVEKVQKKVEELENKAKMNEKLLQNTTGGIDLDLQQKVSGYLLDAIKAKLSIIENINQK